MQTKYWAIFATRTEEDVDLDGEVVYEDKEVLIERLFPDIESATECLDEIKSKFRPSGLQGVTFSVEEVEVDPTEPNNWRPHEPKY